MTQEAEIWRRIAGHPMYAVSTLARVRHVERGTYLKASINSYALHSQYLRVSLYAYERGELYRRSYYLHRLVAIHFVPGRTDVCNEIDHLDGNPLNCRADNLDWVTHRENMRRARRRAARRVFEQNRLDEASGLYPF